MNNYLYLKMIIRTIRTHVSTYLVNIQRHLSNYNRSYNFKILKILRHAASCNNLFSILSQIHKSTK